MARRYDYVPTDNVYGSSADFSDGFSINEGMDSDLDMNDPAAAFLRAAEGLSDLEEREYHQGDNSAGISTAGLMHHRISKMSEGVKAASAYMLGGQSGELSHYIASEAYHNVTGQDPKQLARLISYHAPGPVTHTKEGKGTTTYNVPAFSERDLKTAQGMFTEDGMARYLNRGVGSAMEGNIYANSDGASTDEVARESAYRARLSGAYATINAIAPMYIDEKVPRGTSAYETRLLKVQDELLRWGMGGIVGSDGKTSGGVYGNYTKLPNPNEIHVRGRRSAIGNFTGSQGTPFTNLEYGKAISEGGSLYGTEKPWKYQPNTRKSLGFGKDEKDQFFEVQDHFVEAMDIIRSSTLTTTDENQGNSRRMAGYQQVQEERIISDNILNEAYIQDIDMHRPDDEGSTIDGEGFMPSTYNFSKINPITGKSETGLGSNVHGTVYGSNKGGMYGEKGLSDYDEYKENYTDKEFDLSTERGRYLAESQGRAKQGTPAWLAERAAVDFTASTIGILGSKSGTDKLAVNLKMKTLKGVTEGYNSRGQYTKDTTFVGNTYTKEGNEFEGDVAKFFMARHGKKMGLSMEEAFFERGKGDLSDFGVSPDARLFNAKGEKAGLAEFKLLRDTSIDDALKTYYDQVQLQLAVTGEKEAHLFALDQFTDKSAYHHIKADPARQEFLIQQARAAKVKAESLSSTGVQDLMNAIKGRKNAANNAADIEGAQPAGQNARFDPGNNEEPMKAFNQMAVVGGTAMRVETGLEDDIAGLEEFMRDFGHGGGGSDDGGSKDMDKFLQATRNAAAALQAFSAVLLSGADTVKKAEQVSALSGMELDQWRGIEFAFQNTAMSSTQQITTAINSGQRVRNLNDKMTLGKEYEGMVTSLMGSDLDEIRNLKLPGLNEFRSMNTVDYIAWAVDAGEGMSREARTYLYNKVTNTPGLTANTGSSAVTGDTIRNASEYVPLEPVLEAQREGMMITQDAQRLREASAGGKHAGQIAASADLVSNITNLRTAIGAGTAYWSGFMKLMGFEENDINISPLDEAIKKQQAQPTYDLNNVSPSNSLKDKLQGGGVGDSLIPAKTIVNDSMQWQNSLGQKAVPIDVKVTNKFINNALESNINVNGIEIDEDQTHGLNTGEN